MLVTRAAAVVAATLASSFAGPPLASAATEPGAYFKQCLPYPAQSGTMRICSGSVPSFDGAPLDFDLTMPMEGSGPGPHPMIIMLHGLGGDKHDWESLSDEGNGSDSRRWNNHWFAKHGYYVLTYTARGHHTDAVRPDSGKPATPGAGSRSEPNGTAHLKSREIEIKDTQWLAALAAGAFAPDLDPRRLAVTGGSYGGGESWTLASQPEWTFPRACAQRVLPECQDPTPGSEPDSAFPDFSEPLPELALQVSVPKYPWTDMGYSLAPNGHGGRAFKPGPSGEPELDEAEADLYESSTGDPNDQLGRGNPVGVIKESYADALLGGSSPSVTFAHGTTTTPTSEQPPPNIFEWHARGVEEGDPYDAARQDLDIVPRIRRGLTEYRSSYYQDGAWESQVADREVAIFSIEGWTDDLFTAVESFRQFKYLKRLDPRWPVSVAVADVGHSRAQNKPATWHRLNGQAWQMLQSHINGSHREQTTVYSEPTICASDGEPDNRIKASDRLTATSPEGLSAGELAVRYPNGESRAPKRGVPQPPFGDPDNVKTEPAVSSLLIRSSEQCRSSSADTFPNRYTAQSEPLSDDSTYVGLGHVEVPYTFGPNDQFPSDPAPTTATLNARVWDVAPGGPTLLVTRGTYRLSLGYDTPTGKLRLPLFGNHWKLRPGHRIRLDLTQVDQPTFLPSNQSSRFTFTSPADPTQTPVLHLPTRESGTRLLNGS